jgi:hypothetical protein
MIRISKPSQKIVNIDYNGIIESIPATSEIVLNDTEVIIRTPSKELKVDFRKVQSPEFASGLTMFNSLRDNYFVETTDSTNNLTLALQVLQEQTYLSPLDSEVDIIALADSVNQFSVKYPAAIPVPVQAYEADIALLFSQHGDNVVIKITKNDQLVGSYDVETEVKMYLSEIIEEARVAWSTLAGDTDEYKIEIFGLPETTEVIYAILANTNIGWETNDLTIKSNYITTVVTDVEDDINDLIADITLESSESVTADAAAALVIEATVTYPEVISENLEDYVQDIIVDFGAELPKDITVTVTKNAVAADPIVVVAGTQTVFMSTLLAAARTSIVDSADTADAYEISIAGMPVGSHVVDLWLFINIAELIGVADNIFIADDTTEAIVTMTIADHTITMDAAVSAPSPDAIEFSTVLDYPAEIAEVLDEYEHDLAIEFGAALANNITITASKDSVPAAPVEVLAGETKVYMSTLLADVRASIVDYAGANDTYHLSIVGLAVGAHSLTVKSLVNLEDLWETADVELIDDTIDATVNPTIANQIIALQEDTTATATETVTADAAVATDVNLTVTYPEVILADLDNYLHDIEIKFDAVLAKDVDVVVTKNSGVPYAAFTIIAGTQKLFMSALTGEARASIDNYADTIDSYDLEITGLPVGSHTITCRPVVNTLAEFGTADIELAATETAATVTLTIADHTLALDQATLAVTDPAPAIFDADTTYPAEIAEVLDDYEHDLAIEFEAPLANDITITITKDTVPADPVVVATSTTKVYMSTLLDDVRASIGDFAGATDNYEISVLGLAEGEHTLTVKSLANLTALWGTNDVELLSDEIVITVSGAE